MKFSRRDAVACLVLALVTLAVYWRMGNATFIIYDDSAYITDNAQVQAGLHWAGIKWAFTTGYAANWHPLTWISHMLDCQFFGLDAGKHHLVNVLIHTTNVVLLFGLLRGMTGAFWQSVVTAAFFAWHPLHVESVAWIAERKDMLSTFFWLLTLLAWLAYARRGGKWRYALALVLFTAALLAKPMVVTLPCLLLLLDYWPLQRVVLTKESKPSQGPKYSWPRLALEKIPFIALSGIASFVTYLVQAADGATDSLGITPLGLRVANSLISYCRYLGKIFWPTHLAAFYPYNHSPAVWQITGALLLVAGITAVAIHWRRERPYFIVGWFWFLGTLMPAIGLIQVGVQSMADRYTYVPAVGIFIMVAWGIAELCAARPALKLCCNSLAVLSLAGCIAATWKQTSYWFNPESLFRHALQVTKDNYIMEYNLGFALQDQNKFAEAISHYKESLRIHPFNNLAENNLGLCLASLGQHTNAVTHYETALQYFPNNWATHLNYGLSLDALGDKSSAIAEYSRAISLKPDEPKPHYSLGALLLAQNRFAEAKIELAECARLVPTNILAHVELASALSSLGEIKAAIQEYQTALRLKPDTLAALNNLAWIYAANENANLRNGPEAVRLAEKACDLTSHKIPIFLGTLAAAYAEAGQFEEAIQTGEQALKLASETGDKSLAKKNQELLQLYRAKQPFHETAH